MEHSPKSSFFLFGSGRDELQRLYRRTLCTALLYQYFTICNKGVNRRWKKLSLTSCKRSSAVSECDCSETTSPLKLIKSCRIVLWAIFMQSQIKLYCVFIIIIFAGADLCVQTVAENLPSELWMIVYFSYWNTHIWRKKTETTIFDDEIKKESNQS